MTKTYSILASGCCAVAISCASGHVTPKIAAGADCSGLGPDATRTVQASLSSNSVYGAERVEASRAVSVTGEQPGTDLYVHAQQGLSSEYLERVLSCHAFYGRSLGQNDPFHPEDGRVVRVEVQPAGAGYRVNIAGQGPTSDDEIYRRAHDLAFSSVQAQQLASSATVSRAQ